MINAKIKYNIEFKEKVIHFAENNGINNASILFEINRKSVSTWLKKYKDNGISSFKSKPRKNQLNKTPDEIRNKITEYKKVNSKATLKIIKERLNLKISLKTISNILRSNKKNKSTFLISNDKFEIYRPETEPYKNWQISIHYLSTEFIDNIKQQIYQIILKDKAKDGLQFYGFSYEKSNASLAIFLDYVFSNLQKNNIALKNPKISVPKSSIFSNLTIYKNKKRSLFEEIAISKYNAEIIIDKIPLNNRYEIDFSNFNTKKNIIIQTTSQLIEPFKSSKNSLLLSIPPILVDDYSYNFFHSNIKSMNPTCPTNFDTITDSIMPDLLEYLMNTANEKLDNSKNKKALELYNKIILITNNKTDYDYQKRIFSFLKMSLIFNREGDYELTNKYLENSLQFSRETNNTLALANSLEKTGEFYSKCITDPAEMEKKYNQAIVNYEKLDETEINKIKINMIYGNIYKQSNYEHSIKYFKKMLKISISSENLKYTNLSFELLAETCIKHMKFKKALNYLNKINASSLNAQKLHSYLSNLAFSHYGLGNYDDAIKLYIKIYNIEKVTNYNKADISNLFGNLAAMYYEKEDYKNSIKFLIKNHNLNIEIGSKVSQFYSFYNLSKTYLKMNKLKKAAGTINSSYKIINQLDQNYSEYLSKFYNFGKGNLEFERKKFQNALKFYLKIDESKIRNIYYKIRAELALNTALCYKELKDEKNFKFFINRAHKLYKNLYKTSQTLKLKKIIDEINNYTFQK